MLLFQEFSKAVAEFGPTIELIINCLNRRKLLPSDFERFIEQSETAAYRAEIDAEFKE